MDYANAIMSQYKAALEMLKQTVSKCPTALWNSPDDKAAFWNVAYHTLFYTHLYVQDTVQDFVPWSKHRNDSQLIGQPSEAAQRAEPYDQDTVLEYLAFCQHQIEERLPAMKLEDASGFEWLPFNKLTLHIYSIRHIQQHTGELMERLGTRAGIEIDWVG